MEAKWTRIWWVRPVTGTQAARLRPSCVPVTGRTHQIRVHFASIGCPLAGDDLYGGHRDRIGRQALHCARQRFQVPAGQPVPGGFRFETPLRLTPVTVESPLPADIIALFS